MLRLEFVLMMIPGTYRGINEAAKEEEKTNKQNDARHPSVKPMSFSHTCSLTHNVIQIIPFRAIGSLRHSGEAGSINAYVKFRQHLNNPLLCILIS